MPRQVLSIKAVERALSAKRLARYRQPGSGEGDVEAVARYLWNVTMQSALVPALHITEVTIRNAVFDATAKVANTRGRPFNEVACWLDTVPSLLLRNEEEEVEAAKKHLRKRPRSLTPGHLVSRLRFGFWVNLLNSAYEQGRVSGPALWPAALGEFHNVPRPERTRAALRSRFDAVRSFRNRVIHHEPIWDQNPEADYAYLLQTLRFLNPGVERALVAMCRFPAVLRGGWEAHREPAQQLIGQQGTAA